MASGSNNHFDSVSRIKDDLNQLNAERKLGPKAACTMFQVTPALRKVKPEQYIPNEISMGLYNRSRSDAPKTSADKCRLAIASAFLEVVGVTGNIDRDWDELCERLIPGPKVRETQDLYDEIGRDSLSLEEVQSVLTLDAIFLAGYLGARAGPEINNFFHRHFPEFTAPAGLIADACSFNVLQDILMVENQIPLSLIENALCILCERLDEENRQTGPSHILRLICTYMANFLERFVPGDNWVFVPGIDTRREGVPFNFSEYNNLLDFAYRWQLRKDLTQSGSGTGSSIVPKPSSKIGSENPIRSQRGWESCFSGSRSVSFGRESDDSSTSEAGSSRFWYGEKKHVRVNLDRPIPTASQLQKAGIQFRGRKGPFHDVTFERGLLKATLHVPILNISGRAESIWRNLVAYEMGRQFDDYREFISYVIFMDRLIEDNKDVTLLMEGRFPVIHQNLLGTTQEVVQIFNRSLKKNCSSYRRPKWFLLEKEINAYYNEVPRQLYVDFMRTNFGNLTFSLSVIGAIILLIAAISQAVFTIMTYFYR